MTDVTENQPYYLLQIKILEYGEWYDCRNKQGNILVFLNDFDAINYSKTPDFIESTKFAKQIRLSKTQVIIPKVDISL
jgi:hypothetical protein